MAKRPTFFGNLGTCAATAKAQLTLKPLRRCALGKLVLSAGAGNPAVATVSDILACFAVSEVTIAGQNFIGTSAPAMMFAHNSTAPQPWEGLIVDPSITITVTFDGTNLATLATAAAVAACFEAHFEN